MKKGNHKKQSYDSNELKENALGFVFMASLCLFTILSCWFIMKNHNPIYTYSKDGVMGTSKKCYEDKKEQLICEVNDEKIKVDYYYTEY